MAEDSEAESEFDIASNTSNNSTDSDNETGSPPQPPVSKVKELYQKLLEVQTSKDDNKKGFSYALYYTQRYYWGKAQNCFSDDAENDCISVCII